MHIMFAPVGCNTNYSCILKPHQGEGVLGIQ